MVNLTLAHLYCVDWFQRFNMSFNGTSSLISLSSWCAFKYWLNVPTTHWRRNTRHYQCEWIVNETMSFICWLTHAIVIVIVCCQFGLDFIFVYSTITMLCYALIMTSEEFYWILHLFANQLINSNQIKLEILEMLLLLFEIFDEWANCVIHFIIGLIRSC